MYWPSRLTWPQRTWHEWKRICSHWRRLRPKKKRRRRSSGVGSEEGAASFSVWGWECAGTPHSLPARRAVEGLVQSFPHLPRARLPRREAEEVVEERSGDTEAAGDFPFRRQCQFRGAVRMLEGRAACPSPQALSAAVGPYRLRLLRPPREGSSRQRHAWPLCGHSAPSRYQHSTTTAAIAQQHPQQ